MKIRLLHDWVLIQMEDAPETSKAGLILVGAQPIRKARVIATGPGRRYGKKDVLVPMRLQPGDRFPFFKAATETKQGEALSLCLPDGQELIRETDILFVIDEGDVEVSL